MKTIQEIRKFIMQGKDNELTNEEMKLFEKEMDDLYSSFQKTDELLEELRKLKK